MAEKTCDKCGKKFEMHWNGVKRCTKCGIWLCNDCGYRGVQCPKCKTDTLK